MADQPEQVYLFVSHKRGDDSADGSEEHPVKTYKKAKQLLGDRNGCIKLMDEDTADGNS